MARNKYPEETVKLILDTAEKLILEKGYDNTSIQDIINGLGGLSKGAVYHHFKSKEDIFNAVGDRYNRDAVYNLQLARDDKQLNGYQKLKKMFSLSLASSDRDIVYSVAPNFMENPKLLALQMKEILNDVVPNYVQPVIEEGIKDGSIKVKYPKQLSECMMLLTNLWLNPVVIKSTEEEIVLKVKCFNELLKGVGIDLLDDEMIESYQRYCKLSNKPTK